MSCDVLIIQLELFKPVWDQHNSNQSALTAIHHESSPAMLSKHVLVVIQAHYEDYYSKILLSNVEICLVCEV